MILGILAVLGILLRGGSPLRVRKALRSAQAAGLLLTPQDVEVHLMAGGSIDRIITAAVEARKRGLEFNVPVCLAADRAGIDPVVVVTAPTSIPHEKRPLELLRIQAATDSYAALMLARRLAADLKKLDGTQAADLLKGRLSRRLVVPMLERHLDAARHRVRAELEDVVANLPPGRRGDWSRMSRGA